MSLSTLPWEIRRDIIDSVIEDDLHYRSVNSEWLKQAIIHHGYVYYTYKAPDEIKKETVCTSYFEDIRLYSVPSGGWGELSLYHNLKKIAFDFTEFTIADIEEFKTKLPSLQFLDSLTVSVYTMENETSFDVKSLVEKTCHQLKELSIPTEQLSEHPELTNMEFPNLINLSLSHVRGTTDLTKIIRKMPLLQELKMLSFDEQTCFINITQEVVPNLVELKCGPTKGSNNKFIIDLNQLPKLKKLNINNCSVKVIDTISDSSHTEALTLVDTSDNVITSLDTKFSNLLHLILFFYSPPDHEMISSILKLRHPLSSLSLTIWDDYEFDDSLLVGTHSVTNLQLCGDIILNSKLLIWLSNNFKLTHLELSHCRLDDDLPLEPVALFPTLQSLIIRTTNHLVDFESRFNHNLYPHIDIIKVFRACETCNISVNSSVVDETGSIGSYLNLDEDNELDPSDSYQDLDEEHDILN